MKKLDLNVMQNIEGGCTEAQNKAIAYIGLACTVVGLFGGPAAIIVAPTAIGMGIAGIVCA
ncbi:MAG: hypothetical protein MJ211_05140 [Bacteroidales bacterium]|nr:hypothetical protein [Bacteroidales bacterium]